MTLRDAFTIGWMMGSVLNFRHSKNKGAIDFQEALERFDRANEKKGIPKGSIDPAFGISEKS